MTAACFRRRLRGLFRLVESGGPFRQADAVLCLGTSRGQGSGTAPIGLGWCCKESWGGVRFSDTVMNSEASDGRTGNDERERATSDLHRVVREAARAGLGWAEILRIMAQQQAEDEAKRKRRPAPD